MEDLNELKKRYAEEDLFPLSLGIELKDISPGHCRVEMAVKENMVNFHGMVHGGVLFTLADTAFGLASNTRGRAVALQVGCNFMAPGRPGEVLTATAREEHLTRSTGIYNISIEGRGGTGPLALFRGVVYRKNSGQEARP